MTLGARLQELRLRRGMSQDALADKLGVSRQAVSKWERDEATPDLDKIIKLSEHSGDKDTKCLYGWRQNSPCGDCFGRTAGSDTHSNRDEEGKRKTLV